MDTPILGLHFKVSFNGDPDLNGDYAFQEITGLGVSLDFETLEEGGNTFFTYNLPKKTKNEKIILKRAILESDQAKNIIKWAENALYDFDFKPLEVNVILLNDKNDPIRGWSFSYVVPSKIEYSGINAVSQSMVIETLELSYLYSKPIKA